MKISDTIRRLFRRRPPEEPAAPSAAERRRDEEAVLAARIEAEKLRSANQLFPPYP